MPFIYRVIDSRCLRLHAFLIQVLYVFHADTLTLKHLWDMGSLALKTPDSNVSYDNSWE